MDATACRADIKFPTDLGLLNDAREKSEELIDLLHKELNFKVKPRTYRRLARKDFLNLAKSKRNGHKKYARAFGINRAMSNGTSKQSIPSWTGTLKNWSCSERTANTNIGLSSKTCIGSSRKCMTGKPRALTME